MTELTMHVAQLVTFVQWAGGVMTILSVVAWSIVLVVSLHDDREKKDGAWNIPFVILLLFVLLSFIFWIWADSIGDTVWRLTIAG